MLSWMTWQIASLGPMGGQAVHFLRYAYEHDRYGIQRYVTQSRQLYNVLEKHFSTKSSTWLVGDKFTIADIACFPWVNCAWHEGITIEDYPAVKAWRERIGAREGVKRGMLVPAPFLFTDEFTRNPGTVETRIAIRQGLIPIIKKDVETWFKEPGAGFMEAGPDEATKEQT